MNAKSKIIKNLMEANLPTEECERTIRSLVLSADNKERTDIFDDLVKSGEFSGSQLIWLARVISDSDCGNNHCTEKQTNLEDIVTEILHELGVPAHLKGYNYLRASILLAIDDEEYVGNMTKKLYPSVAEKFCTTSSRVERAIRHAIEVAWDRGDADTLIAYFGSTIKSYRGNPTNTEFIAMIADKLKLKYKKS